MIILLYAICGAIIGWSLGTMVLAVGLLLPDVWYGIREWLWDVRCRIVWQRELRSDKPLPPEYAKLAAQMVEGQRIINVTMPTMRDVAKTMEAMVKR